jgi:hydroxypyruvate isomerase
LKTVVRFSANLGFLWAELPLLERIDAAAKAGFRAVELHAPYDVPPQAVAERCADRNVKLLGINTASGSVPGDNGLAAVPGREDEARRLIDQAFDYAAAAGGTAVHVMAGKIAPGERAKAEKTFVAALRHAASRAEASGLIALLEPINQRNMPGYFYSEIEKASDLIDEVRSDALKIMFDCYHVGISQGDVLTRLRRFFGKIGHVQIAAVPSRAEPDEGELAYRAILAELDALNYQGWVGCEYRPRADTDSGLTWLSALGFSLAGGPDQPSGP